MPGAFSFVIAVSTDGTTRASASASIGVSRGSARAGSFEPRIVASPARTLQCGSGSRPDSTVRNVSSSRFANPCSAASLTVGSGSPRKSTNASTLTVRGRLSQRQQRLRAHHRIEAARVEQFRQRRLASRIADTPHGANRFDRRSARRARSVDQRKQHGNGGGIAQPTETLYGKRPGIGMSPRARASSNAGSARLSSMRCSAYATGHHCRRGCPSGPSTDAGKCVVVFQAGQRVHAELERVSRRTDSARASSGATAAAAAA